MVPASRRRSDRSAGQFLRPRREFAARHSARLTPSQGVRHRPDDRPIVRVARPREPRGRGGGVFGGAAQGRGGRPATGGNRESVGGRGPNRAYPRRRTRGGGGSPMSDVNDRLAKLSQEQRRLLERKLRERGLEAPGARPVRRANPDSAAAEEREPDAWRRRPPEHPLRFSLYFFSDDGSKETQA